MKILNTVLTIMARVKGPVERGITQPTITFDNFPRPTSNTLSADWDVS